MSFTIGTTKPKKKGTNENSRNIKAIKPPVVVQEVDDGLTGLDMLLEQAHDKLSSADYKQAIALLTSAKEFAENDEDRAAILELFGQVYTETGDVDNAIAAFKESEAFDPNNSFERLLALGQLTNNLESLQYYKAGLMLLHNSLVALGAKIKGESRDITHHRNEISETASMVMCSMADLYVTDLCDEDNAETECESLLQEAAKTCPTNCESFRLLSNLRTIQGNKPQATKYILHAYKLLESAVSQRKEIPEFLARVEMAKLLLELEQWNEACALYAVLLDENSQFIELWYQCGVAHINIARIDVANKIEHEYGAAQFLLTAQKLLLQDPDEELQTSIDNQLRVLTESGVDLAVARSALDEARIMNLDDNEEELSDLEEMQDD